MTMAFSGLADADNPNKNSDWWELKLLNFYELQQLFELFNYDVYCKMSYSNISTTGGVWLSRNKVITYLLTYWCFTAYWQRLRTLCVSASLTTIARRSICRITFIAQTPVDASISFSLSMTSLGLTRPWSAVAVNVARWSSLYVAEVCSLVSTSTCTCTLYTLMNYHHLT